jgi:hypothetical protein
MRSGAGTVKETLISGVVSAFSVMERQKAKNKKKIIKHYIVKTGYFAIR